MNDRAIDPSVPRMFRSSSVPVIPLVPRNLPVASAENGPRSTPPLDATELQHVLNRLHRWTPLHLDDVFDDLNRAHTAHGGVDAEELSRVVERLRGVLTNLVSIGRTSDLRQLPPEIDAAVKRGAALLVEEVAPRIPSERSFVRRLARRGSMSDPNALVRDIRRLGWITQELLELMSGSHLIKDES